MSARWFIVRMIHSTTFEVRERRVFAACDVLAERAVCVGQWHCTEVREDRDGMPPAFEYKVMQAYGPRFQECIEAAISSAKFTGSTGATYTIKGANTEESSATVERPRSKARYVNIVQEG